MSEDEVAPAEATPVPIEVQQTTLPKAAVEKDEAAPPPTPAKEVVRFGSTWLAEGLPLSAVAGACWPTEDPKVLLKQSWTASTEEVAEDAPPPSAFDPTAATYSVLPARLAKSKALQDMNRLKIAIANKEDELRTVDRRDEAKKEALNAELDELKAKLDEATAAFGDLKTSFADDATSLVPWMQSLFAQLDLGVTTFTVAGDTWPHCNAAALFAARDPGASSGVEAVLAAFKKRCRLERGAGAVQVVLRLTPNIFKEGFTVEAVTAAVERLLAAQEVDESGNPAALDAVELAWWDDASPLSVAALKLLSKLSEDETQTDPASGDMTVTAARRIKALGVYNYKATDVLAAIVAGASVKFAHVRFGLHCASTAADLLRVCRDYGIAVLGDEATMLGLLDDAFLGLPCPSTTEPSPLLHATKAAVALVHELGGWGAFQTLLAGVKRVADKHKVKVQTVALRWVMDKGVVPTVPLALGSDVGAPYGHRHALAFPPVDAQLLRAESFLDADDMAALDALAR